MCFEESSTSCARLTVRRSEGFGSKSCGSIPGCTCAVTSARSPPTCCAISVRIVEKLETRIFSAPKSCGAANGASSSARQKGFVLIDGREVTEDVRTCEPFASELDSSGQGTGLYLRA